MTGAADGHVGQQALGDVDTGPKAAATTLVGHASEVKYPVFVYGTLKRKFPNAVHMNPPSFGSEASEATVFLDEATTVDRLPLVVGPYGIPFLLDLPGRGGAQQVRGELYTVTPRALKYLDAFEGVPEQFYERMLLRVARTADGSELRAWTYVRHPRNGGAARWTRDWTVERLAGLEMLDEYNLVHSEKHVRKEVWK